MWYGHDDFFVHLTAQIEVSGGESSVAADMLVPIVGPGLCRYLEW